MKMFIALIANQYTLIKIIVQKYFQFVPVNYKYFFYLFLLWLWQYTKLINLFGFQLIACATFWRLTWQL